MTVTDALARQLRDLRISVTDRCNFRCVYCMPREVFGRDYEFLERAELLTFEEIERLARIFVGDHGVEKIRLTGGEPLVRREVERLVEMLARIPGLGDLAMTTNGSALARKARALRDAGLRRITVSLDSLDNEVFAAVNDVGFPVERVLAGIEAAAAAGLGPIKINMVVKRGVNEDSVVPMARHFRGTRPHRALHRVHGRRSQQRLADGRGGASGGDRRDDRRRDAARAGRAELPGEVVERWRYTRRQRRDRRDRLGDAAVLRRLHARPAVGRRQAVHLPVRHRRVTTCARCCAAVPPMRRSPRRSAGSGAMRDDRYSELRTAATAGLPKVEMSYIGG